MRRYRIKRITTYNKLGDFETKFINQKNRFWFWWKNIEFIELTVLNPFLCIADSYYYVNHFSTYYKAYQALLKYNEIEGRTYQTYEGYRICIAIKNGDLVYCYKNKDADIYYYFRNFDLLKTHIKSNKLEHKELISSYFNLK